MNANTAAQLQRDQQWSAEAEDAHIAQIDAALKDLHTAMPGIIQSFDPVRQTATIQPAIQRLFVGDSYKPLPVLVDCPVVFPAGGGNGAASFVLTFPVAAGDECLVIFSERAIDNWFDRGGVQIPAEYRMHDLSDGFALVGISSRPRFVPNVATDATELRTRDGTTVVRVEDGAVFVGGKLGAEPPPKGETMNAALATLTGALATYVQAIQATADISPGHTVTQALTAAIGAFNSAAEGWLAAKANVL